MDNNSLTPPDIEFDENQIPHSRHFNDSYYSKAGGFEETKIVFHQACNLPNAWQNSQNFTIGETGFGTGLNFLCTWDLWNKTKPKNGILHFISFELYLMDVVQAKQALAKWPELEALSELLLAKWPVRTNGAQRIWFEEYGICLDINIGDARQMMPKLSFKADAWFLDGFAPARNPELWGEDIFKEIRRLSKPEVKIGTYSVAQIVRHGLESAGFKYQKCEGFAGKRERLEAWLDDPIQPMKPRPQKAIIIGGGVAGTVCAYALSLRNVDCYIIDNDKDGIRKASNNPAGLIMPRIDRLETREARFFRAAFLQAIKVYNNFGEAAFKPTGVLEFAKFARDIDKFAILKNAPPLGQDFLLFPNESKLHHLKGAIVYPSQIVKALGEKANKIFAKAIKLERDKSGFIVQCDNGATIEGDICIIANGQGLPEFLTEELPLVGRTGVVSFADVPWPENQIPFVGKAYALPHENGILFGATYQPQNLDEIAEISDDAHEKNIDILNQTLPSIAKNLNPTKLKGRASMRVAAQDRLPVTGKIEENLYVLGALGSRGFSTAPMGAEIIASLACHEPLPIEDDLIKLISPNRFLKF